MAISSECTAQDTKKTCENHTDMDINMYCYDCKKKLCSKCIKENHRLHDWETLDVVIRQKSEQAPVMCKEIREQNIPQLQGFIQELKSAKLQVIQQKKKSIDEVKSCRDSIVSAVVNIADEQMRILENESREINTEIDNQVSTLEMSIEKITDLVDAFEINARSRICFGITELEQAIQTELNGTKQPDTESYTSKCSRFVKGGVTPKILQTLFGYIQNRDSNEKTKKVGEFIEQPNLTVSRHASFSYEKTQTLAVIPMGESTAWLHSKGSQWSDLLSVSGTIVQRVDMNGQFSHFMMLNDGDFIYVDHFNRVIYRIPTTTQTRTNIMDTAPLHPYGISLSLCGDIFITLVDDKRFTRNKNSKRLVRQVTMTGAIIRTYQYKPDSDEQLFFAPYRVKQNFNTDICVVDHTGKYTGRVYILGQNGSVKCKYEGQELSSDFLPNDIACDNNCNILICDTNNHAVHLLDCNGTFLKLLLTYKEEIQYPTSLAIGHDKMWIGSLYGKIYVYKYK